MQEITNPHTNAFGVTLPPWPCCTEVWSRKRQEWTGCNRRAKFQTLYYVSGRANDPMTLRYCTQHANRS